MRKEQEDFSDISKYSKNVHMFQLDVLKIWGKGKKTKDENNALYDLAKRYGITPDYAAEIEETILKDMYRRTIESSDVEFVLQSFAAPTAIASFANEKNFKTNINSLYNEEEYITPVDQMKICSTGELLAYSPGEVWEISYQATRKF